MSFEAESKAAILERLKKDLTGTENKQSTIEGSFNADMLTANAIEFENQSAEEALIVDASYAETSWGEYLTMLAEGYGVIRKAATYAVGEVTVSGEAYAEIIKGSMFATADGKHFYASAAAKTDATGKVTIPVVAEDSGSTGNVAIGAINTIPMSIPGVTSVTNEAATYDGFEEETDDALRARYLLKVRTPATSGNLYHYQQWALEVAGVGQAKCLAAEKWKGAGTVGVIILDSDNKTASTALVAAVAEHIESVRPIGAHVDVVSPTPKPINIEATIYGTADADEVKDKVNAYLTSGGFNMRKVSYAKVNAIIMSIETVSDLTDLKLNGAESSVTIGEEELAAVGEVTLHVAEE